MKLNLIMMALSIFAVFLPNKEGSISYYFLNPFLFAQASVFGILSLKDILRSQKIEITIKEEGNND